VRSFREVLPSAVEGGRESGRTARLLAVSLLTGVLVALIVAAFEVLTVDVLLERLERQELWVVATAPTAGLLIAAVLLRWGAARAGPATSDEYVRAYHERRPRLPFRPLPAKLFAGAATIGSGGALGLEGPSIYAGSVTGLAVHRRLARILRREDARLLLAAGAAAGVAAVFKAPATGVLFALEAPYRGDLARRALLPALIASAAAYTTYVAIVGLDPVVPFASLERLIGGEEGGFITSEEVRSVLGVEIGDLFGALLLGVGAGLGGRLVALIVRWAKIQAERQALWRRVSVAGIALALLAVGADAAFDEPLTIGPGLEAVRWVTEPDRGLGLIALLFGLRLAATTATLVGGGVGGLFIPLVVQGAILGQFVGEVVDTDRPLLYPTLGVAASLGAGYRTPIAAVMFVAEVSPTGGYVVPALVAAAVSQLVAGRSTVSAHQSDERRGHLERRFELPLTAALTTDVLTVPPDATLGEFVHGHALGRRQTTVPVVDGSRYLGMIRLDDLADVPRDRWDEVLVGEVLQTGATAAAPSWTLRDVVAAMEATDATRIAVCGEDGSFIGVVDEADIVELDEILDQTGG
jgi:chloride channel protein, CIC family